MNLQKKLLEMLTWLTKYLDANGLTYYVVGGTMLGAVRHQGFIPWDDDIDVALPRPDYERLIAGFKGTKDHYILETPYDGKEDFLYTFAKFYDVETTLVERKKKAVKRGVYIDVFPLDGVGNDYEESYAFLKKVDRKNMFLMTRTCAIRKQRKWYKNAAIVVARCLPFVNDRKLALDVDKTAQQKSYDECAYVANLSGAYREKEIVEKRIFGTPTDYPFENITVKGPELYDEFLTHIYKNWRELPPVEKRGIQHDFLYLNLEKSYLE